MTMIAYPSFAGKTAFNTSTFGVLPAAERLTQARKALADLRRTWQKRAAIRGLEVAFPAWPEPVAHVESRSQLGHWHTVDLTEGTCDCPAWRRCSHLDAAAMRFSELRRADEIRAARERQNWRLLQATYGGSIFRYEPDQEAA